MSVSCFLDEAYELAGRHIDPVTGTLRWQGSHKHLRRKELEVLAMLAEANGDYVPRQAFIDQLWRGNVNVGEQALTDTIAALRRSLPDKDRQHPIIRTIPRQGYQLSASVVVLPENGASFVAGVEVRSRPGWRLRRPLSQTNIQESWLAENDNGQLRVFRFCRSETHLRRLQREITLMRYLREALAARQDIATIISWRLNEPPYFLEMEHSVHGDMLQWSEAQGGLANVAPATRMQLLLQTTGALAAVHSVAIVHRSLSPSAIGIEQRDGLWQARLGEFGLGLLSEPERLQQWQISSAGLSVDVQSLQPTIYVAPESGPGEPSTLADDVYALGVLGVQLNLGQWALPVLAEALAMVQPLALRDLLLRCLAPRAEGRPDAQVVCTELSEILATMAMSPRVERSVPLEPAVEGASTPLDMQLLGPYRILDLLGHGGMGTVYLAEQAEPVRRKVALKLVKAGLDSEHVLARFEAERQALALMNHPNVAAIFDAGSTPTGLPYFAMEYVPGMSIDSHCDHYKLSLRGRLELFLQVCDGVLHAHQKGLVHRDLKPGNIMVRQQPEQAQVKIIDFGVAKSLQASLVSASPHTRFGHFVGTPTYSSPEQVAAPNQQLDTRADIFSLGVVLYQLLIGVTPRTEDELSRCTPLELAKLLRNSPAPSLLCRYSQLSKEQRQEIAGQRSISADALHALLSTDLEWIVGKCLASDPEDRFATVQDLKKDLRRWLEHRPIEARPTSSMYRFRKLIRRNRLSSALTAAAVMLLAVSTTAAVFGYYRAEQAAVAAAHDRDVSEQVIDLLTSLFASADPYRPGNEQAQDVRHILAQGLQSVEDNLHIPSDVRNRLMGTLADVYGGLGEYEQTLRLGRQVLDANEAPSAALSLKLLQAMANASSGIGRPDQAVELGRQAVALARSASLGHAEQGKAELTLGLALGRYRDHVASARHLHAAYEHLRAAHGEAHLRTISAMMEYGSALSDSSRFAEAEPLLRRALELNLQLRAADDMEIAYNQVYLGQVLLELDRGDEAVPLYESAVRSTLLKLGPDHPDYVLALSNLAYAYERTERFLEALPLREQILISTAELHGYANTAYVTSRINLGANLLDSGEPRRALSHFERGREILIAKLPDQSLLYAVLRQRLAEVHWALGQRGPAGEHAVQSLAALMDLYPEGHVRIAAVHLLLVKINAQRGDRETAIEHAHTALSLYSTLLGPSHWRVDLVNRYMVYLQSDDAAVYRGEELGLGMREEGTRELAKLLDVLASQQ